MVAASVQPHRRRRWWRLVSVLFRRRGRHTEQLTKQCMEAKRELARAAQARGNDYSRQVLLGSFHGVVNNSEGQVDNVFMNTARYNPVYEQRLQIERINDFRHLRPDSGRQVFFFRHSANPIEVGDGSLPPAERRDIR
jgi:hypothetical protein